MRILNLYNDGGLHFDIQVKLWFWVYILSSEMFDMRLQFRPDFQKKGFLLQSFEHYSLCFFSPIFKNRKEETIWNSPGASSNIHYPGTEQKSQDWKLRTKINSKLNIRNLGPGRPRLLGDVCNFWCFTRHILFFPQVAYFVNWLTPSKVPSLP